MDGYDDGRILSDGSVVSDSVGTLEGKLDALVSLGSWVDDPSS